MIDLPLATDAAVADAILLGQSRTPVREQHAAMTKAVHNIREGERQRAQWERRGILLAQTGELFEALNRRTLIEGESCWTEWG